MRIKCCKKLPVEEVAVNAFGLIHWTRLTVCMDVECSVLYSTTYYTLQSSHYAVGFSLMEVIIPIA